MRWYRGGVAVFGTVMIGLGCALLVRGALAANPVALLIGVLFAAAGAGRLYLLRRR